MKVFLDTHVWLSATVFAGLCAAILTESHRRDWLLTTPLVQAEATCVQDLGEPADDNDVRLVKAASVARAEVFVTGDKRVLIWGREGNMQILSPRGAWMQLFAGIDGA